MVNHSTVRENNNVGSVFKFQAAPVTGSNSSVSTQDVAGKSVVTEKNKEKEVSLEERGPPFSQPNPMMPRARSNTTCRNYNSGPGPSSKKRSQHTVKQNRKPTGKKNVSSKPVAELFASKKAQEEVRRYEVRAIFLCILRIYEPSISLQGFFSNCLCGSNEMMSTIFTFANMTMLQELKNKATSELNSLYDEIRPAIEEHERDSQDNVTTSIAEKWIQASCSKWKAEFDFHFSIIKNVLCPPSTVGEDEAKAKPSGGGEEVAQNEIKN